MQLVQSRSATLHNQHATAIAELMRTPFSRGNKLYLPVWRSGGGGTCDYVKNNMRAQTVELTSGKAGGKVRQYCEN